MADDAFPAHIPCATTGFIPPHGHIIICVCGHLRAILLCHAAAAEYIEEAVLDTKLCGKGRAEQLLQYFLLAAYGSAAPVEPVSPYSVEADQVMIDLLMKVGDLGEVGKCE